MKFGTYTGDSATGNDYADQRYYTSTLGRFMTPDPVVGKLGTPQSWNRYSYAMSDPVGLNDPTELFPPPMSEVPDPGSDPSGEGGGGWGDFGCPIGTYFDAGTGLCLGTGVVLVNVVDQDPCPGIAKQIWQTITGTGMPGAKSLLLRVVQQITGDPSQFDEHQEQIDDCRNRLKNLRRQWNNNDCDPPDDPPYGTNDWISQTSGAKLKYYSDQYQQFLQDISTLASDASIIVKVAAAAAAAALWESITVYVESLGALAAIP